MCEWSWDTRNQSELCLFSETETQVFLWGFQKLFLLLGSTCLSYAVILWRLFMYLMRPACPLKATLHELTLIQLVSFGVGVDERRSNRRVQKRAGDCRRAIRHEGPLLVAHTAVYSQWRICLLVSITIWNIFAVKGCFHYRMDIMAALTFDPQNNTQRNTIDSGRDSKGLQRNRKRLRRDTKRQQRNQNNNSSIQNYRRDKTTIQYFF